MLRIDNIRPAKTADCGFAETLRNWHRSHNYFANPFLRTTYVIPNTLSNRFGITCALQHSRPAH